MERLKTLAIARIRLTLETLAIATAVLLFVPVWAITSIVCGCNTAVWLDQWLERRRSRRKGK